MFLKNVFIGCYLLLEVTKQHNNPSKMAEEIKSIQTKMHRALFCSVNYEFCNIQRNTQMDLTWTEC